MKKILLGSTALLLAACAQDVPTEKMEKSTSEASSQKAELGDWGITLSDMNTEIDPGDDFFRYVNGKWLDTFEIPEEFSNYGSFTVLFERSEAQVKEIIETAAEADAAQGSVEQKIGDYFDSYIDTDTINNKGLTPIESELSVYRALEDHEDVAMAFSNIDLSSNAPFAVSVGVDNKNPEQYITSVWQSGLGMPNKSYYLKPEFEDKREAYKEFLVTMLGFVETENVEARAQAVYDLELALAEVQWEPEKSRQADLTYNLYTLEELEAYAPDLPWRMMMDRLTIGDREEGYVVRQNDAVQASAKIFAQTPVEVWRDYLMIHSLSNYAAVLPAEIDQANFDFFGKSLSGVPAQRERWKRGVAAVNGAMGEAVGQIYVEKYFPPESKAQMEELVNNLKEAFALRLDELNWMGEETKEEARAKLAAFNTKIAYPDKWTDYSSLEVVSGDAFGNFKRANLFAYEDMVSNLGQPIDDSEWFMTPQTVNAYYSRSRNEIVFPAAILQPPFFDPNADPAVNYGGIGAVIGHEIGHGFDDQGSKADGTGLQRNWWTEEDAERFGNLTTSLGAQYATYSPIEGHFVNPELTMGENIGDLGGVTMAYDAYKLSLEGKEAPVLDGFTGDQRFFMAWAQVWKRKYREDELKRRLATDSHSPSEYRTNGVVRNMDQWYDAFDVQEDDDLFLPSEERVQIW